MVLFDHLVLSETHHLVAHWVTHFVEPFHAIECVIEDVVMSGMIRNRMIVGSLASRTSSCLRVNNRGKQNVPTSSVKVRHLLGMRIMGG